MKRITKTGYCVFIAIVPVILSIGGCASIGAVSGVPFEPVVETPADQAVVYFYKALGYGRGEFPLVIGERVVTVLKKGGYYPYFAEPGSLEVTLIEHKKNKNDVAKGAISAGGVGATVMALIPDITHSITMDVKAGHTYYVKEQGGGGVGLEEVSEKKALGEIEKCKLLPEYKEEEN